MRLAAEAADGEAELPAELVEILAAAVPQLDALQQVPNALVGIEVWGVAGQAFQVQPRGRTRGKEVLD